MQKQTNTTTVTKSHHARTLAAAFFGFIGIWLLLTSVLVVWLNRTLTDTATFSSTVAPLVTKPAIQDFVAGKVTDQLLKSGSPEDIANSLLPASETAGKNAAQLQTLEETFIRRNVTQVVQSPGFVTLWKNTTTSAHQQLLSQINSGATELTLDLSPAITGVVAELKQTDLAPVSDKIAVEPDAGKVQLKGDGIAKAHKFYTIFQAGSIAIVVLAVVMIGLSIALSVHHAKTVRRTLLIVGIAELLTGLLLFAPSAINVGDNSAENAAAVAFVQVLVRNLQIAMIVIGVLCLLAVIGSKLYSSGRLSRR